MIKQITIEHAFCECIQSHIQRITCLRRELNPKKEKRKRFMMNIHTHIHTFNVYRENERNNKKKTNEKRLYVHGAVVYG